uniref:Sushi domain-containing protein n=1 Tax=Macrostomum lignano TaxID=282301 RepID=A0A1I8HDW6_9PLAT
DYAAIIFVCMHIDFRKQDAVWGSGIPTCVSRPCTPMPVYPNDTAVITSYTFKGVTYSYSDGQLLTQLLSNGTFRPGDNIQISCKPDLMGSSQTASCMSGGSWSPVTMDCSPGYCGGVSVPPTVANAQSNATFGNTSWEGASLAFTCNTNYSVGGLPNGSVSFVISCINSSWTSFAHLNCRPTACSSLPPGLGNSSLYSSLNLEQELQTGLPASGVQVDDSLSYECRPGFVRTTQNRRLSIFCRLGDRWEPDVPGPCQLLNCSQPDAIVLQPQAARMTVINASFNFANSSHLPYTSLVRLSCEEPYFAMPGSSELAVCGLSDGDPPAAVWRSVGSNVAFSCRKHCNNSLLAQLVGFGLVDFPTSSYTDPDRVANVTCLSNAFAPLAANVSLQSDSQFLLQAVCTAGDWTVLNQLLLPTSETLCQPKPCLLPTNLTRSTAVPSNNLGNVTTGDGQVYLPVNSTVEVKCWPNSRFVDAYASSWTATCELGPQWSSGGSMNCQPIACPDSQFGAGIDPSVLVGPLNATTMTGAVAGPFFIGDQVAFVCRENASSSGYVRLNCTAGPNFTGVWQPNIGPPYCP